MGPGIIFKRLLNKLEARQSHRIERQVIRSPRVPNANGAGAKIVEWRQPRFENWPHHLVPLKIYTADLSTPVVHVEVPRKFRMFRSQLHRLGVAEVLLNV